MLSATSPSTAREKAVGVRSSVACITCRRAKLRCDGQQRFPAPCSRCALRNSLCQLDRSVKTPRKRQAPGPESVSQSNSPQAGNHGEGGYGYGHDGKLADLSRQLAEIRNALNLPGRNQHGDVLQLSGIEVGRDELQNRSMEDHLSDLNGDLSHLSVHHKLGKVSLNTVEVDELYSHFYECYYSHCPILRPGLSSQSSPAVYPLLFWTVMLISSGGHPHFHQLHYDLIAPHRDLMAAALLTPNPVLEIVQAIILLLFWPLDVEKQIFDPSWTLCGWATHAALKLRLHKFAGEDVSKYPPWESSQKKLELSTWVACYSASIRLAWTNGLAPPLSITRAIEDFWSRGRELSLPEAFLAEAHIHHRLARSTVVMMEQDPQTFESLVGILSDDLNAIRSIYRSGWNYFVEIELLGAQLNLYALAFQRMDHMLRSADSSPADAGPTMVVLHSGLNAAIAVIQAYQQLDDPLDALSVQTDETATGSTSRARSTHLPKHYLRLIVFASCFIFRVLLHHSKLSEADQTHARNQIQLAQDIILNWSILYRDERRRAALMLQSLGRMDETALLKLRAAKAGGRTAVALMDDTVAISWGFRTHKPDQIPTLVNPTTPASTIPEVPATATTLVGGFGNCAALGTFEMDPMDWNVPWALDGSLFNWDEFRLDGDIT